MAKKLIILILLALVSGGVTTYIMHRKEKADNAAQVKWESVIDPVGVTDKRPSAAWIRLSEQEKFVLLTGEDFSYISLPPEERRAVRAAIKEKFRALTKAEKAELYEEAEEVWKELSENRRLAYERIHLKGLEIKAIKKKNRQKRKKQKKNKN